MTQETKKHLQIKIPRHQSPQRIDKFLAQQLPDISRAYIQYLIQTEAILVNGKPVKPSHKIAPAEKIDIYLSDKPGPEVLPENIPLDIVYEDEALLVVNKPAGMVVHPAFANYTGTLVNALLYHYQQNLSSLGGSDRPGIVHRLDKDTSGLMVVAKNDRVHAELARQFSEKTASRKYLAVVWGKLPHREQTISNYLARSQKNRLKMTVVQEGGKWAVTHIRVLEQFDIAALIEARLETGRTHQIRVHMAYIGHPVLGDPIYGGRRHAITGLSHEKTALAVHLLRHMPRQALHAAELRLFHPLQNKEMVFEAPLPEDMQQLLSLLREKDGPAPR